jgi:hypothetical protein
MLWLPGGKKLMKSLMASIVATLVPSQPEANPTAKSIVGKKARNRLKAMA